MLFSSRTWLIFFTMEFLQMNCIQTSYVRHLFLSDSINHLTYYPPLKWFYVASINSLSIYDENFLLLQNISIEDFSLNESNFCEINPCQCLNNLTNEQQIPSERKRRSIDTNNYNLILYLETNHHIDNQPYLIDCWSLQSGSCIVRHAFNLSKIYYQHKSRSSRPKFLFNTDSFVSNHIFPFHLKFNKCPHTPTYLFLTSTLKKTWILSNHREKSDELTDAIYGQCLEQAQRRTIALRSFITNDEIMRSQSYVNKSLITPNTSRQNVAVMKRQVVNMKSSMNKTRSSTLNISNDHVMHGSSYSNNISSTMHFIDEHGPFVNINDYCPEQLAVLRSIYTDFFERESPEKFRIFQDIIYDRNDSAIYVFTNQQYRSKIIRLCEGQISFRHYVELEIGCGIEYTLVQKVKLVQLSNNKEYLIIIASKPRANDSLEPSIDSHSAICLYELEQIRHAFIDNVLDLAKGNVSLGMAWLHGESVIPQYPIPYGNLARCSTMRDASYLMIFEGPSKISSQPVITFPSDQLTALQATIVNNDIVVLAGTADGKVKKISIQPMKRTAFQFEEIFVHFGEAVLRDLILDENNRFLYGSTKTRLFQVDLHNCDQHKTCLACLSSQNPYCHWATTLNRCTVHMNVTNNHRQFSWLQIHENCPSIIDITPGFISKAKSSKLRLRVASVPDDTSAKYSCSFGLSSLLDQEENNPIDRFIYKSNAIKSENFIECYSPPPRTLSNIDHGNHSSSLRYASSLESIVIRLFYNEMILAERNVTFYDCSSYRTCTWCMNNSFDCSWKLLSSNCVDSDLIAHQNETIITHGLINQCPRYNVSIKEIFVADGRRFSLSDKDRVSIQTSGIKSHIQKYFRCILTLSNGSLIESVGKIRNNLLICQPFQISYDKDVAQQNLSFDVQWKECTNDCIYKTLETLTNFTVNIYKCKYLADSCGSCILLDENYRCIWCETDKSCRHEINSSTCRSNQMISSSMGICPDPRLRQISPRIGPQYGQTPIHLFGSNLGKKVQDISVVLIHSNQTIYPCRIDTQSYVIAQSFICQPSSLPIGIYTIKVTVHSVVSKDRPVFHVVKPMINDVHPNLGPRSGGTLLSLRGKHLTIGSKINIFVGHQECFRIENEEIISSSTIPNDENNSIIDSPMIPLEFEDEEILRCRTSKLAVMNDDNAHRQERFIKRQALWIGTITIFIDNFTETYSNITYSYTEDPRVYNLSRYSGIESGGLPIVVFGSGFDSIQTPQFFIEYQHNQLFLENCSVTTSETLLCYGPAYQWLQNKTLFSNLSTSTSTTTISPITHLINSRSFEKNDCLEFQFGFVMDDVEHVRNVSNYLQLFLLCPDPIIYPFNNDGKRVQYRYDYLTIEGMNLLDVATINDYSITIGSYPCNITSISDKQIVCQPTNRTLEKLSRRKRILLDLTMKDNDQAIVRVTLGRRVYTLGTLTYTSNHEKRSLVLYYIIASICGFLLTLFIIIVSILFRRINTKRTRQVHRLQNQIDTLEMRVARECKEAFAELQTDIGEMANDLSHSGVPYHDYRTFCMKVLFPNITDEEKYMLLHNIELPMEINRRNSIRQGLQLLSQSFYNRHFLLIVIRTLEMDKINFRLQDRMRFASLISILLQDSTEYFTEILKILLRDLIEKTIQQDRNNSKILLRSNASIAEKMLSNWFAFFLFGYIKEHLGSPLYILFQSIKQQIQKGPIDCFTNESRYSLSEDKLLRQHIDYSSMIVYVVQIEDDKSHLISTPVPIKVLSCDSITQVKEKIVDQFYKNIPFSKRPSIEDFDLEWRVGSHMKLLRDDEKLEHPDSNGFVQIQTLASYKVHDGARLFLSLKPGTNQMNTSSSSSLASSSMKTNHYGMKTIETDQNCSLFQGTENQILLNSSADLPVLRKDHRVVNPNPSDPSYSRPESNTRFSHLVKPTDREDDDRTLVNNKLVSEVYLTRLLATKGSLQQYIDNFFDTIFCLVDLPSPIKYLFDFLDEQAEYYQIFDPNIIHTWKSNSLPLRFFVNIIKNPDFIFDVQKSNVIDASLSVIAQMFMDSCAAGTHQLTKDSPSSKLLFYRDVQKYKKLVEKYYDAISSQSSVSISDLDRSISAIKQHEEQNTSSKRTNQFNRSYVLLQLYNEFLSRYKNSLRIAMANDYHSKQYRLAALFEQIVTFMESFELDI